MIARSWSEAKSLGLKRYFTDRACLYGHVAERLTSNGLCLACRKDWESTTEAKSYYRQRAAAYRAANPDAVRKQNERRDPQKLRDYAREYARNNADLLQAKRCSPAGRAKRCAEAVHRYAAKRHRTPAWADQKKIERFYADAQAMTEWLGEPVHVDHIVPLQGKRVSGLHVHENLQLLPGRENCQKSNSFDLAA